MHAQGETESAQVRLPRRGKAGHAYAKIMRFKIADADPYRFTEAQTASGGTPNPSQFYFFKTLLKTLPSVTPDSRSQVSVGRLCQADQQ
jgi:hypothetical protein